MINDTKLLDMIINLKKLESYLEKNEWENETKILEYNELQDEILDYLKRIVK